MFNDNTRLTLDVKVQDRLRQWFSKRGPNTGFVNLTCVQLGDSDVHYEMSQQYTNMRVLNSPYQVEGIKHKLLYTGAAAGLTGNIEMFKRYVNDQGIVASYYTFPVNTTLTQGVYPPTLANGNATTSLLFNNTYPNKEGWICFFETVPDGYLTPTGDPMRFVEPYTFTQTNLPNSWEIIPDYTYGSLFICRPTGYVFSGGTGSIQVVGQLTSITTTITFNF